MPTGTIYGIGVGPGDPQLLTLRAVAILQSVTAVLVPRSKADRDSLALSIARTHLPAECEILEAVFPMTEDRAVLERAWEEAAGMMLQRTEAGQSIAFLTLGDAMFYSTWSYLMKAILRLKPDAAIVTIPGITAMSACAAATGVPLAEGREPLIVWPDLPPEEQLPMIACAPNLVFMKAARHLEAIADAAELVDAQAVAVRRVTLPEQEITTDLRAWTDDPDYFTTVIMHAGEYES